MKNNLNDTRNGIPKFSLFHNNVRSQKLRNSSFKRAGVSFSVMGITETRLANSDQPEQLPSLPGYEFEFVPSPLSAGGFGMFISDKFKYEIIEKTSTKAFQALWVEFLFEKKNNIICGIIYRQHNSPESFQANFDEALERFSQSDKTSYIMGDFNTNLETCNFTKEFLLTYKAILSFQLLINQLEYTAARPRS